ncbi:MAG: cohesin domain-containing protein, partial [Planctomycetota bacterium]
AASTGYSASLCLEQDNPCVVTDSAVTVRVVLDPGNETINGAQFTLDYDMMAFEFVEIFPGSTCDANSPFAQEIFRLVNENTGEILYAVGPPLGGSGASEPTTVACLVLQARAHQTGGDICINTSQTDSFLADGTGQVVVIDNSQDCPDSGNPPQSCIPIAFGNSCTCEGGAADCSTLTNDCMVGSCEESVGVAQCQSTPVADGTECNDGFSCTINDNCQGGVCLGEGCEDPSVCLTSDVGCEVAGGVLVRVELGEGSSSIFGAQLVLDFDPTEMELLEVLPGSACDPESPFAIEIEQEIDRDNGRVFYAVGIDFVAGTEGTEGPATLACLAFAPFGNGTRRICLLEGSNPQSTILTNDRGQAVGVFDGLDCPTTVENAITCTEIEFNRDCACTPNTEDCTVFNSDCRQGFCDEESGICKNQVVNNGEPCYDGSDCSMNDMCIQGRCVGFGCDDPSLCVFGPGCVGPGLPQRIEIVLGDGDPILVGGQFNIGYNPDVLQFLSIAPGQSCDPDSPFSTEVFLMVDEELGQVFYAVGIDPNESGSSGPATMACLEFIALKPDAGDVCILSGLNPFRTILSDESGNKIHPFNNNDCPFLGDPQVISCGEVCTVPTVSQWGLVVLALGLLVAGKGYYGVRSRASHQT